MNLLARGLEVCFSMTPKPKMEKKDKKKRALLQYNQVPKFARECSIYTGYRDTLSYKDCIKSIFHIHNETVNIWTHFLGFVYFLFLLKDNFLHTQPHNRSTLDVVAVGTQLLSYQACMLMSSLFHTFLCHSEVSKHRWKQADHAGILAALWGTYVRLIVTNFGCFPSLLAFHLLAVSFLFSLVFVNKWRTKLTGSSVVDEGGVELYLFLALALYSVAPFAHWISITPSLLHHNVTNQKILWMFFPYLLGGLGLVFYVSRFPECCLPKGRVDLCGASHQIWHMLIFAGMASWYELSNWLAATRPTSCILIEQPNPILFSS